MNKKQLSGKIAKETKLTKAEAEQVLDIALKHIGEALVKGDKVRLVGFGNFIVRTRAGRVGRNPRTGEKIEIGSTKTPAFVPGINLKAAIKGK